MLTQRGEFAVSSPCVDGRRLVAVLDRRPGLNRRIRMTFLILNSCYSKD
jgi:hypothetical protein